MSERENTEFKSVDSFSQLPFIRPAPPSRDKNSSSSSAGGSSAIRLFGIDFTHEPDAAEDDQASSKTNTSSGASNENGGGGGGGTGGSGADNGRKFECHYCCRNFPTSQALGGHQNAHKRERQHAKRAHLQSAMAAAHSQVLGGVADGQHFYGLLDYHRLDSMASGAGWFGFSHAFESPLHSYYPSSSRIGPGSSLVGARFYSGYGPVSRPIDDIPLPGAWGTPEVQVGSGLPPPQRERPAVLPLLAGDEARGMGGMRGADHGAVAGGGSGTPSSASSPPGRLVYETAAGVQDHLSLDLHL